MIGSGGLSAEVSIRPDQAGAEEGTPGSVDSNSVSERVLLARQPARQSQAVLGLILGDGHEYGRQARFYLMFWVGVFSTMTKKSGAGVVGWSFEHYESMIGTWNSFFQIIEELALFFPTWVKFEKGSPQFGQFFY